ncbi:MAG: hypothetical protein QM699_02905 [Amaricoccus sp.]|uniref:hypothetical protein n=1 Tax=Amaricoccus sp. TaxID=1872485 RepID=UPI0039E3EC34
MGGRRRRTGILLLAGAAVLGGCGGGGGGMEVPGFLGREGNAASFYNPRGEAVPDPVPLPIAQATSERSLYGAIVRVSGPAPSQGFWGAELRPLSEGPDANGVLAFEFVAIPPADPAESGPPQTRTMSAGTFIPTITARKVRKVEVRGSNGAQTLALPAIPAA